MILEREKRKMFEKMPEEIKKAYIISIFAMILLSILGIIFNCVELYYYKYKFTCDWSTQHFIFSRQGKIAWKF